MALSNINYLQARICDRRRRCRQGVFPGSSMLQRRWRRYVPSVSAGKVVGAHRQRFANKTAIFDSAKRGAMRASMQEGEVSEPNRQTAGAAVPRSSARASSRGLVSSLCPLGRRLIARGSTRSGRWPTRWLAIDSSF